jgi:hypothetical protein
MSAANGHDGSASLDSGGGWRNEALGPVLPGPGASSFPVKPGPCLQGATQSHVLSSQSHPQGQQLRQILLFQTYRPCIMEKTKASPT